MFNDYGSYKMGVWAMVLTTRADSLSLITRIQYWKKRSLAQVILLAAHKCLRMHPSSYKIYKWKKYGTHL